MMRQKRSFGKDRRPVRKNCVFCTSKTEPKYREADVLAKFITERGKIVSRSRTGVCSAHQRALTAEIKKARHIAILPYVVQA